MEPKVAQRNNHVIVMAFGLPIMTTAIVMGSMYAGHLITQSSDRPAEVRVQTSPPKIDINVPQSAPPNINVSSTAPKVDIHVPQLQPPTVTVNTPQLAPPNITVNPPAATVTVIEKREGDHTPLLASETLKPAATKPQIVSERPAASAPIVQQEKTAPVIPGKPTSEAIHLSSPDLHSAVPVAKAEAEPPAEPTLENLYSYATRYVDMYCQKRGLDSLVEARRWNRMWQSNVDQAIADNIDSSEQSYINRIVITKRDYFNLNTATPEKIVEACRIMLRYRDGQLAWLQAMKDSLTNENLKKTMAFLAQGPK
jgi:hypothetical protein